MEIKDLIKFEPIDLTHIAITIGLALIVIYAFKSQLDAFFDTLQNRPITVKVSGSETTIKLDAPVQPELLAESISNPQGSADQLNDWGQIVREVNNIEGFQKLGFDDLYEKLSALDEGRLAAINYTVDDWDKFYFNDEAMLRYLSIASEKVRYLAFYKSGVFVAAIGIEDVISGLASNKPEFANFGDRIREGQWQNFPSLITRDDGFEQIPTVEALHARLLRTGLSEVPLSNSGQLIGFLGYKSVSDELYAQVSESEVLSRLPGTR